MVEASTFLLTLFAKTTAADMTVNEAKGLNSFRCAANALFTNVANLALSVYYTLRQFELDYLIKEEIIDRYYPSVCTCTEEIEAFGHYIMGMSEQESQDSNAKYIGVCSESARQSQEAPQ